MDRDRPLTAALGLPDPHEPARQVDVVPVEAKKLASPEAAVRHQRQEQPVAFRLAGEVPLPHLCPAGDREQPLELAHRQHVGQRLPLLRRPQRKRGIAEKPLLLDEEAEEEFQRRRRARLARGGRARVLLTREEGAQVSHLHLRQLLDPLTLQVTQTRRNVTLVR